MASRFLGEFDVAFDYVDANFADVDYQPMVGDWLIVGRWRSSRYVTLYTSEISRESAMEQLRWAIRCDWNLHTVYDYELWHVVETPDWMPRGWTVNCIELLDHADRGLYDETLVWCDLEDNPYTGVVVVRTSWGFYVPVDRHVAEFPRTLHELTDWKAYDFVEVDTESDDFAWVPTAEINAFCGAFEGLVSRCDGLDWCDVQRLRISGDALRRMACA